MQMDEHTIGAEPERYLMKGDLLVLRFWRQADFEFGYVAHSVMELIVFFTGESWNTNRDKRVAVKCFIS